MKLFNITDKAKSQMEGLLSKNPGKYAVSLSVLGGGCAGFKYDWGFTDIKESGIKVEASIDADIIANFIESNAISSFHISFKEIRLIVIASKSISKWVSSSASFVIELSLKLTIEILSARHTL